MSDTITQTITVSDSAKAASIVTDTVTGYLWDLANPMFVYLHDAGSGQTNTAAGLLNVPFATAQAAWLATRS